MPNIAPIAVADGIYSTHQGVQLYADNDTLMGVLDNDGDGDGDPLTAELVDGPGHAYSFQLYGDGQFTYTPNAGYLGDDSFTYRAWDGAAYSNTVAVSLLVTNATPVATPDGIYSTHQGVQLYADNDTLMGVLDNDDDSDDDPLTAELVDGPDNAYSFQLYGDGQFTYTPNAGYLGDDSFTYRAWDGAAYSNTVAVSLLVTNATPVATPDGIYSTHQGVQLYADNDTLMGVLDNDDDSDDDPLTAELVDGPDNAYSFQLYGDGQFTYTPNAGYLGDDSFAYRAWDGAAYSNTVTVSLTVTNLAPVAVADGVYSTHQGVQLYADNDTLMGVLDNDDDSDDDPLTAELVDGPDHAYSFQLYGDGQFTYTPAAGYLGNDSFTYRAWDGAAYSNTVTVSLTVANLAPVAVADGVYSTQQGVQLYADNDTLMGVLDNDDDSDDDPLTAELVDGPNHAYSFQLYGDGQFTYTPAAGFAGADSFTYQAWDGAEYSNIVAVSINVSNIAPVAVDDAVATDEDVPVIIDWASNDSDDGGDTLTIQSFTQGDYGAVTQNQDGNFTYTPDANWNGTDSFSYTMTDGHGGTDTAVVSITVNSINDAPIVDNDTITVGENTPVGTPICTVAAYDPDLGQSLSFAITGGNTGDIFAIDPITGEITLEGSLDYESTPSYVLTVTATDDGTPVSSACGEVAIDVEPVPDVSITASQAAASEIGPQNGVFTVSRSGATTAPLTVSYAVGGSAATNGDDYTALSGTVVIPADASTTTIKVSPVDDDDAEGMESVVITLVASLNYDVGMPSSDSVMIEDSEATVSIHAVAPNATEGSATPGVFVITRTGPTTNALPITVSIGGTAANGTDYTTIDTTIPILADAGTAIVNVAALQDNLVEPTQTILLTLVNNGTYNLDTSASATVNILDVSPTITITAIDASATENPVDNGQFRVTRTGATTNNLTVNYTISGNAVNNVDYQSLTGAVTILAGQPSRVIDIVPIGDTTAEGELKVILTLSNDPSYIVGASNQDTVTIRDDGPWVRILPAAPAREEGPIASSFTIERSNTDGNLVVGYTIAGTATNNVDYQNLAGTVTIQDGASTGDVTITPINDPNPEAVETVILTLNASTTYLIWSAQGTATGFIVDNDNIASVSVDASTPDASEQGPTNGVFTFGRLNGDTTQTLTVNYVISGTATNGTDYQNLAGSITFAENETSKTLNVVPIDDALPEGTQTVVVTLSQSANYDVIGVASKTVNILDNENTVSVSPIFNALEDQGAALPAFQVSRTGDLMNALTVNLAIGGTAINGTDYNTVASTVTIPAGMPTVDIDITPIDDNAVEPTETISILVANSGGYTAVSPVDATVTLRDSEPTVAVVPYIPNPPNLPTNLPITAREPDHSATFWVGVVPGTSFSAPSLTVEFNLSGSAEDGADYVLKNDATGDPISGSLILTQAMPSVLVRVEPIDDLLVEAAENVVFSIASSSAYYLGSATTTVTLLDDDSPPNNTPRIGIVASDPDATENGADPGVFTVFRSGDTSSDVTVSYSLGGTAENGIDYGNCTGTVTILANQATARIDISPVNDATAEGFETVIVYLQGGAGYVVDSANPNDYVMIIDDEPTVTIEASDANAAEAGGDPGVFTVSRTGPVGSALTVYYSIAGDASNGIDYALRTGVVIIPADENTHTITIAAVNDTLDEPAETVTLTLTPSTPYFIGVSSNASVTIADDDDPVNGNGATVSVTAGADAATEQGPVSRLFTFSRTNPINEALTVSYTLSGTATNGIDFTTLAGTVMFDAGENSKTVALAPIDDSLAEGDETVVLTINVSANYQVSAANPSATLTIADNEAEVSVTATTATTFEDGQTNGQFTFSRTGLNALTVYYTISGTASNGVDYGAISGPVLIQQGQASQTVNVVPLNDSVFDPGESVIVSISTSPSYALGGETTATVTIIDDDVRLKSVSYGGAGIFTVQHDVTGANYDGNHWQDTDVDGNAEGLSDHKYPVGYAAGSTMSLSVTFAKDPLALFLLNPQIKGSAAGFAIDPTAATVNGDEISIAATAVVGVGGPAAFAAGVVRAFDPMTWTWQVSNDGAWLPAQSSSNPVYVTRLAPIADTVLRHTVVRLSTLAADGAADDDAVINAVFGEFANRSVIRVDNPVPLTYYGNYNTFGGSTTDLLESGDAQCPGFNRLFLDMLKAHGIQQANSEVRVISSTAREGLLVHNWAFNGAGYDPNGLYPYINVLPDNSQFVLPDNYTFALAQVTESAGLAAQSNTNPASAFTNHQIARLTVGGVVRYFDASYGAIYSSLTEMSAVAIAGFLLVESTSINEAQLGFDLNGDGDQLDVVGANHWRIRKKNPFDGSDLKIDGFGNTY